MFSKSISSNVTVIKWPEIEFAQYDVTVQYINHYNRLTADDIYIYIYIYRERERQREGEREKERKTERKKERMCSHVRDS